MVSKGNKEKGGRVYMKGGTLLDAKKMGRRRFYEARKREQSLGKIR